MRSGGAVVMKVPAPRRDMAKEFQKEYYNRYQVELPLWRCLVEVENRERKGTPDPFRHLKRGLRL